MPGSEFAKAERVSDILSKPNGAAWWKANGSDIDLEFDLTDGSYSMTKLEHYLEAKGKAIPWREQTVSAPEPIRKPGAMPEPARLVSEANSRTRLAEVAKEYNLDAKEFEAFIDKSVRRWVAPENTEVCVAISPSRLGHVLDDGRFKSQFETGRSGGLLNTDVRARAESNLFGLDKDTDPTLRPIYGFLKTKEAGLPRAINQYARESKSKESAKSYVVLKSEVRERSTFMMGDSLDMTGAGRDSEFAKNTLFTPSPLNDPAPLRSGYSRAMRNKPATMYEAQLSYTEVQVHGGLKIDQISEVVFDRQPAKVMVKRLEKNKIPWRIDPSAFESETRQ